MTQAPVQANVVLSADNSQYDQAMDQSAQNTDRFGKSVDSLGGKIDRLTKSAGKKMFGMTMADVGVIGAATAAWAHYEKQMQNLTAQAAVVSRTQTQQTKVMGTYTDSVKSLRTEFGLTTDAAATLTQTISKMPNVNTGQIKGMATLFQQMSLATGESAENLASSVLNLQNAMSTPVNATTTRQYADTLTYLAAKSNTSASALADFTSQMAPMGKAMGMTGTQVIGLANMFTKAGQEGYTAAGAATKVMQDITYATQTGSPVLNQYANLLGVTTKQFKSMTAIQQVAGFFDEINKLGPQSSLVLQQFGFDGIRMSRAIQAAVQSSGGAMNAVQEAQTGALSGSTQKGSDATDNLVNNLQKVRQELEMTAESFASVLGPGINEVVKVIDVLAEGFNKLMSGPFGKFAQVLAAILVPLTALTGGLLMMASAIGKVMMVATVARSSLGYGVREGIQGRPSIVREMVPGPNGQMIWTGGYVGAKGAELGARGAELAELDAMGMPKSSWVARSGYNYGQRIGGGLRGGYRGVVGMPFFGGSTAGMTREEMEARGMSEAEIARAELAATSRWGSVSPASRMLGRGVSFGGRMWRSQFDQLRYQNVTERDRFFGQYFGGRGPDVAAAQDARIAAEAQFKQTQAAHTVLMGMPMGAVSPQTQQKSEQAVADAEKQLRNLEKAEETLVVASRAQVTAQEAQTAATKGSVSATEALKVEAGQAAKTLAEASVAAGKFTASAGIAAGRAVAPVAGGALRSLGSSALGLVGGGPGLALTGLMMAPFLIPAIASMFSKGGYQSQNLGVPGQAYLSIAGTSAPTPVGASATKPTLASAVQVTPSTRAIATAPNYKLNDQNIGKLTQDEVLPYIQANWKQIKNSPEAIAALRDDLTNKFGGDFAQNTISTMMTGTASLMTGGGGLNVQSFFQAAQGSQGPAAYDVLASLQAQRVANIGAMHGAPAQFGARGRGLAQELGAYITSSYNPAGGGTTGLMAGDQGATLLASLKNAFGVSISSDDMSRALGTASMQAQDQFSKYGLTARRFLGTQGSQYQPMTDTQRLLYLMRLLPQSTQANIGQQLGISQGLIAQGGTPFYNAITQTLSQRGGSPLADKESVDYRVSQLGPMGQAFVQRGGAVARAVAFGADQGQMNNIPATVTAINSMMDKMNKLGMSAPQIEKSMGDIQSAVGNPDDPKYIMAGLVSGQAQQDFATKISMMPRGQAFQATVNQFQAQMAIKPVTPQQFADQQQAKQQMVSSMVDQVEYFRQMNMMQQQYDLQRSRAEADYHQQQMWNEQDYQIQRQREEVQYNLQRSRTLQEYHIQVRRAWQEFYIQRQRAEEAFNHQTELEAKQMADSVYNVYQRVQVERTSSVEWTINNAADQLQRMQQQEKDLKALRAEGLSTQAIQMLQLTDPAHQQQLAVDRQEMTKKDIQQANELAKARLGASKADVTDPSNPDWQERIYQRNKQMTQGREDMDRQMRQGHDDLFRHLRQNAHDFNVLENQQASDHQRQLDRTATMYHTTMARMAQDLALQGKELDTTLQQTLDYAVKHLTGHAQQQAIAVKKAFGDLQTPTTQQAAAIMKELGRIFGFAYTVPKGIREGWRIDAQSHEVTTPPVAGQRSLQTGSQWGWHEGGVIPGYTPGRDNQIIYVSGGEGIMRPEWVRAMGGEKVIEEMNHRARHGGFASGGVVNPDGRVYMDGQPVSRITKAQILLAEKLSKENFSTLQGSWQPPTSYSGTTHTGPGVVDETPGSFDTQYWMRRVGFAAWGRNFAGAATAGSGAHVHSVSRVDPGVRGSAAQQIVDYLNGGDGLGGRDYGPRPAVLPNLLSLLGQFGDLQLDAGDPSSAGGNVVTPRQARHALRRRLHKVLSDFYMAPETAAINMQGIRPLDPGQISTVINRFAHQSIRQLIAKYGLPGETASGPGSTQIAAAPSDVAGAVRLGKQMAASRGWTGNEWNALYQLWSAESGWRTDATNPQSGAYGIPQSLPASKMAAAGADYRTNAATQIKWGLSYIKSRYGDPVAAWGHETSAGWYGNGGVFDRANIIGVGEHGPEAVIPLNARGADFMTDVMAHTMGGRNVAAMRGGATHIYATRIDRSTNFTGPITVQANDPDAMIKKLQARQRVMALSRPVLTGSAA